MVVVVLNATVQSVLEEAEVEADVELGVGLPREILVLTSGGRNQRNGTVGVGDGVPVGVVVAVQSEVVTVLSVRDLELQLVHPVGVEPLLLVDHPSCAGAIEVTPSVVGVEGRRSLAHAGQMYVVTVVVAIHGTCQPRLCVVREVVRTCIVSVHGTVKFNVAL